MTLSACVAGPPPVIETPQPTLPTEFASKPDTDTIDTLSALLPHKDASFVGLAELALESAPTFQEAIARIEQARAQSNRSRSNSFPELSVDASGTASQTSPEQFGAAITGGIGIDTERASYGANLRASWELDLFGRLRAQERAAKARLDAATAEANAVRNSLIAEIAGAVIDWRTISERETSLQLDLMAAQNLATLAASREKAGLTPGFDRVRAEAAAQASTSRIAALGNEKARILGRLVTLTGQNGQMVLGLLQKPSTLSEPTTVPASLPSALLINRPDVRAAAANLAAADEELSATAARRFPQLNLTASLGLLGFNLDRLFQSNAVVASAGSSLLAPLLDFGRIEAEIDASAAAKRIAFARYRDSVFSALGEAEASYGLVSAMDLQLEAARQEYASATRAANIAEARYRAGLSDFLTVLEARRAADASGERVAIASGQSRRSRILLWQALGGHQYIPHASN
ncbi:MAG: efflux transporter outer membrane subunit [Pseudomonadota bacterium]